MGLNSFAIVANVNFKMLMQSGKLHIYDDLLYKMTLPGCPHLLAKAISNLDQAPKNKQPLHKRYINSQEILLTYSIKKPWCFNLKAIYKFTNQDNRSDNIKTTKSFHHYLTVKYLGVISYA